jgi:hypothetical protein
MLFFLRMGSRFSICLIHNVQAVESNENLNRRDQVRFSFFVSGFPQSCEHKARQSHHDEVSSDDHY